MYSRWAEQLTEIERAIDDLACGANAADPAVRVAELWRLIAELDPELARRVLGYTGSTPEQ